MVFQNYALYPHLTVKQNIIFPLENLKGKAKLSKEEMNQIRDLSSHYSFGGHCKIIVLTADAIKGTREHLIDKGFDEYLWKPINTTELEQLFLRFIPNERITYDTQSENSSHNSITEENTGNSKN